jgi:hypothetical protein
MGLRISNQAWMTWIFKAEVQISSGFGMINAPLSNDTVQINGMVPIVGDVIGNKRKTERGKYEYSR